MALVTSKEMFAKALVSDYAIGAFNVNNMEIVQGITRAAKKLEAPVILQCSSGSILILVIIVYKHFGTKPYEKIEKRKKD